MASKRHSSSKSGGEIPAPTLAGYRADFRLTPAQARVLYWMVQGKRNREIAELLEIHTRTVEKHIEHIFDALGVESRTAAVIRALEKETDEKRRK